MDEPDTTADDESSSDERGRFLDGRSTTVDRRTLLKGVGAALTVPAAASAPSRAQSDAWSLVVLPDTQSYARRSSLVSYARDQVEWIVEEADDVAFVSHEGDVVWHGDDRIEWRRMDDVLDGLDGEVPYSVAVGDHDFATEEVRSSGADLYREYFGADRYDGRDWYGGAGPDECSHYQLFSAGGYDFLHLALEWEAPGDVDDPDTPLGWAQRVIDEHDRPTIVTTHSYLWDGDPPGRTDFVQEDDGDGSSGQRIWEELIEPNPQVFMVLCGNYHERSGWDEGEYRQVSTNADGQAVYELLANYQSYANGGDGWLREVRFVPGGGDPDRIEVQTYSPSRDEYQTDDSSEFGFDLDFDERFGATAAEDGPPTASFQQGVDGYEGTVDTYLQQAAPEADNGSAETLVVRQSPEGVERDAHALLRFEGVIGDGDGQVPEGATVESATLTVETANEGAGARVHRMLTEWSESDTWAASEGGIAADGEAAAADPDARTGWATEGATEVDVTESVQAWADGDPNHGWALLPETYDDWGLSAAEGAAPPALVVEYQPPEEGEEPQGGTVTLQQGEDGYEGTVDTYVQETAPEESKGDAAELTVDRFFSGGETRDVQALVRFDGLIGDRVPEGATVESATLTVETTNLGSGADVHRMLVEWSESATWASLDGGVQVDGTDAAAEEVASTGWASPGEIEIDVTESVQAWADGDPNHGWVLASLGDNEWRFSAAEGEAPPRLSVTYDLGTEGDETSEDDGSAEDGGSQADNGSSGDDDQSADDESPDGDESSN